MLDRHNGLYSLGGSTLSFLTDPAQRLFCPMVLWWGLWSGESNGRLRELSLVSRFLENVPLIDCLSPGPFVPRFSAGVTPPSSLRTLELGVLWPPPVSGFGGRPWPVTYAVLLSLVLSVPSPSLVILPLLGCFGLSPFRLALGRTSLWILLRICLPPQEIQ